MRKKLRERLFPSYESETSKVVMDDDNGVVILPTDSTELSENSFLIEDALVQSEDLSDTYTDIKDMSEELTEASAESLVGVISYKLRKLESLGVDTSVVQLALDAENFKEGNPNLSTNCLLAKEAIGSVIVSLEDHLIPVSTLNLDNYVSQLLEYGNRVIMGDLESIGKYLERNDYQPLTTISEDSHIKKHMVEVNGEEVETLSFQLNYHDVNIDLFNINDKVGERMSKMKSLTDEVLARLTSIGASVESYDVAHGLNENCINEPAFITNITIGALETAHKELVENTKSLLGDLDYFLSKVRAISLKGLEIDSETKTLLMGWYNEARETQSFLGKIVESLCLLITHIYNT